jgi:hypothetical protein
MLPGRGERSQLAALHFGHTEGGTTESDASYPQKWHITSKIGKCPLAAR